MICSQTETIHKKRAAGDEDYYHQIVPAKTNHLPLFSVPANRLLIGLIFRYESSNTAKLSAAEKQFRSKSRNRRTDIEHGPTSNCAFPDDDSNSLTTPGQ
jgi:hypothetical protein